MKTIFINFFLRKHYKNTVLFTLLFVLLSFQKKVPTPNGIYKKMQEIEDAAYKNTYPTDKSIKIVLECYNDSRKIDFKRGIKRSGLFLMILYVNKADYHNAIKISNEIESVVKEYGNYRNIVEYHTSRAYCLVSLGLLKDGYQEYLKAINAVEKIPDNDDKYYKKSDIYLNLANYHIESEKGDEDSILYYYKKALQEAEKISEKAKISKTGEKNDWIICLNYFLGKFYLECESPDINLSRKYFEKARYLYENSKTKMLTLNEIAFLSFLSQFYYIDKNYNEAVKFGLKSLELQKKESDLPSEKIAYEYIAKSYQKLGNDKGYQEYINKYITLSKSLDVSLKLEEAKSLETITKEKEEDNKRKNNLILYTASAFTLIIGIASLLFWKYRNKKIHHNYLAIIEKLKSEKENKSDITQSAPEKLNTFNIPEDTYRKIIFKIERFEKNLGFLKKDMTLSYLSSQFKTNPKSLSLVIKSKTDKNFNTYINDLRINYIIQKLYENRQYREFKINYLAEECGYSSPKVFVTAFKKLTGVTPSYYITNLKNDLG